MRFTMIINNPAAALVTAAITSAVRNGDSQFDGMEIDGEDFFPRDIAWEQEFSNFSELKAWSLSSKLSLTRKGEAWEMKFDGLRGSLQGHWQITDLLSESSGEISDYETSIPGMLPWESIYSWYRRLTGDKEVSVNPFSPIDGHGEWEQWNNFNRRFYAAVKELARKRKLRGPELRNYRKVILADINRRYGSKAA